jgi:hypothetical protein
MVDVIGSGMEATTCIVEGTKNSGRRNLKEHATEGKTS